MLIMTLLILTSALCVVGFLIDSPPMALLSSTIAFFLSIAVIGNVSLYSESVAQYRNVDAKIANAQTELDILSEELNAISPNGQSGIVLNNDSPYRSLIEARTELRKMLLDFKNSKVELKNHIDTRRLGFSNFVTFFVDDKGI